jgi:ABC-2 type transport system ATP-binding protein
MLGNPKVLILDEPANGLDPAGIREIRELLRQLAHERRMSIFVSSHLLSEVEVMCDRVAIIHHGRILKEGPVHDLISAQREMELRVGDAARALAIARERGLAAHGEDDKVWIAMEESDAPPLIAALAAANVAVYHAQRHVQSLEQMFLEATGGETVD